MALRLYPLTGWPFAIDVRLTYSLGDRGLTVETRAENVGSQACPFASGPHPYLSPGEGLVDACELSLPAATRMLVDDERQLPVGSEPVDGGPFDFRSGRPIGDLRIDHPFTDLSRDSDGRAVVRLARADGRNVELWADRSYSVLEVYTGDTLAPARRRRGLAVEPMTCPPNALQSGEGIVRLKPGQAHVSRWGVRFV
jgi:aldose 1-epimerase